MSKITGHWKRTVRPIVLNAIRRFSNLPTPTTSVFTRPYVESIAIAGTQHSELTLFPCAKTEPLPAPRISGNLIELERVLAQITCPESRAKREQVLKGIDARESDEFVANIDGGCVTHDAGVVITPDNLLLADTSGLDFSSTEPTNPLHLKYLPRAHSVQGCVAVLASGSSHNYYHWMIGTLPRLDLYERTGKEIDHFYVSARSRFQRESLHLLGVTPSKILRASRNRNIVAERLMVSSWNGDFANERTCNFLFCRMTRGLESVCEQPIRAYISRHRRGKRIVVNEQAVFSTLKPLGFRRFNLEIMSLAEQVALFHRAECVVGPHGAGLTNTLFCRSGAKVVEIGTPYRPWTCFYEIASQRKLEYHLYMATPVNVSYFDNVSGVGDSDMLVPPDEFRGFIEKILS